MKEYLNKLPQEIKELINIASEIAVKNNMRAYLVGGFVRDLILGVDNLDLDIVVEGEGIKFAQALAQKLEARIIEHKRFGTATVMASHKYKIDVATARKEVYPQAASLPIVQPGSLKDDLIRRDFTINAMAIDIMPEDFGRLIDVFSGKDDLKNKKIRFLHNLSFIDDPTRMLRAMRFEQRYDFKLEANTLKYLKQAQKVKILESVEPQRLRDELILALKEHDPLKLLKRINELLRFSFVSPGLSLKKKDLDLLVRIKNQIDWFERNFPTRRSLDIWLIYLLGLLAPLDKAKANIFCKSFALRRSERIRILSSKSITSKSILDLSSSQVKASKIFSSLDRFSYEVIIFIKAKYKNHNIQEYVADFFEIYNDVRPYISGDDLRGLGITPSPLYKKVFTKVLNAKLDGVVKTKEEEMALIKKLLKFKKE